MNISFTLKYSELTRSREKYFPFDVHKKKITQSAYISIFFGIVLKAPKEGITHAHMHTHTIK